MTEAKALVKTAGMPRSEWLAYRTMGIGGSDVSIIAGINPFKSVHELWLEKTGQVEPEETDSEAAHFGTILEPVVRKEFMERTGLKVRQKHMLLQSVKYPFMLADLDGVINEDGEMVIFEAKTASEYKKEVWEDDIPAPYRMQLQHYMAVTGAGKAWIAALVGGNKFFCHEVMRDEEMISKIIAMEKFFWEHHVQNGVEPVPDGSEATTEYLNRKFLVSNGGTVRLPEKALAVCDEYMGISEQIKVLEKERDAAANQLKNYLKEAEIGIVGDKTVIWKPITKNLVDAKRLRTEQPELYGKFLKKCSYRRMSVA